MPRRLKVTDVNPHVMCTICAGYLVDATAIIECLHAFCRTCIVRYLENSEFCPVCEVQVHTTTPLRSIRSDQTLQDVVYKVVPGLYQNEMQRRREFYSEHPEAVVSSDPEERGEGEPRFFSPKESISLSLQYRHRDSKLAESSPEEDPATRHLNCPAAFTVGHLKKFVRVKFSLPSSYAVDIFYDDEHLLKDSDDAHLLKDSDTLMDVAYMYSWKRAEPMKFFYSISKRVPKIVEPISATLPPPATPQMEVNSAICETATTEDVPEIGTHSAVPETYTVFPVPETSTVSSEPGTVTVSALTNSDTVSTAIETEQMQVDTEQKSPKYDKDVDKIVSSPAPLFLPPPEEKQQVSFENLPAALSSPGDVQPMDTAESEFVKSSISSLPQNSVIPPPMPEPTYNSVKLVSTPERDTMLSPTNGFRLKFIHDPELNPKSRSKKSGRKGGRSSRHKNVPVRLARLAPYPPPPPPPPPVPVTCLTSTQPLQHLPQLTVGKLVPAVITTLAPTFVTTLVSTTSNTLCNVTNDSNVPNMSSFLGQPSTAVCNISTHSNGVVPSLPSSNSSSSKEDSISLSSTATAKMVVVSNSPSDAMISTPTAASQDCLRDSPATTKELPYTETAPKSTFVISSCAPVSVTASSVLTTDKNSPALDTPNIPLSSSTEFSNSTLTNSSDLPSAKTHTSDNLRFENQSPKSTTSLTCSKDVLTLETISLTSSNVTLPVSTVPTTNADSEFQCNSSSSTTIKEHHSACELMTKEQEKDQSILGDRETAFESANQKSESFKMSVKNSISAEFSDNDDLGCQPDLVVDEQKMDSSDNEEDTDAALRRKINAIAEKEDEADVTDDTEADSGRASDMSCSARCEEDMGSPATTETVTSLSVSTQPVTVSATISIAPSPAVDGHRHTKSNNIDHVIKQLYLQHEIGRPVSSPKPVASPNPPQTPPKDVMGVLDLSTCTRKPGEIHSTRPKSVANPVLDIKHRQQTYLPAPIKQHTACPPAPKHPTSPLLRHQQTTRQNTPSILQARLTGPLKPSHHPLPYSNPSIPYSLPVSRSVSSPSSLQVRPSQPIYSYKFSQNAAHQAGINMFSGMLPYPIMDYAVRSSMVPSMSLAARSSTSSHPKEVSSSSNSKMPSFTCHTKQSSTSARRLSDTFVSSTPPPGHGRLSTMPSSPTSAPAHPRTSPSMLTRMSPHHRSASPAPCTQTVSMANSLAVSSLTPTTSTTSSQNKPSVPMYKKSESSSYKGFKVKRNANLAVFNPDPNGYHPKIVIKNLDSRSNNHH